MNDVNSVRLVGTLASDPRLKTVSNGSTKADIRVFTSEPVRAYINVTSWDEVASQVEGAREGDSVSVEGFIKPRKTQEGIWALEVVATSIRIKTSEEQDTRPSGVPI